MFEARSYRWKTTAAIEVDAYFLTDGLWLLFAYVKDQRLATEPDYWAKLMAEFTKGRVIGVARALKTEKGSEPLESLPNGDTPLPAEVWCREGWLKYRLETSNVLNPGLFLDQELNRQKLIELIQQHIGRSKGVFGPDDGVLNLFSYTGSFTIAALCAGVKSTTSIDVSSRYLAWENENFAANFGGHDQIDHRVVNEDAREYLRRAQKRGARYRWIIIDPPTFSRGKGKPFKIQEEMETLLADALACLAPGGAMLASGNDARWDARAFSAMIDGFVRKNRLKAELGRTPAEFGGAHALKSAWIFSTAQ